jgi:hypothetical protein
LRARKIVDSNYVVKKAVTRSCHHHMICSLDHKGSNNCDCCGYLTNSSKYCNCCIEYQLLEIIRPEKVELLSKVIADFKVLKTTNSNAARTVLQADGIVNKLKW